MRSEAAPSLDVRPREPADGPFGGTNILHCVGLSVGAGIQRVVRLLTLDLQQDEHPCEVADARRKLRRRPRLPTRDLGLAMLQCAVRSMPRWTAGPADEQIRRRRRQGVKHRVVRGADGTTQPRLGRAAGAGFRQGAGGFDQVWRVHNAVSPYRLAELATAVASARSQPKGSNAGGQAASEIGAWNCRKSTRLSEDLAGPEESGAGTARPFAAGCPAAWSRSNTPRRW